MDKYKQELKTAKILVALFHEEMKSNSVTEFIIWLECKNNLQEFRDEQMKAQIKQKL